MIEPRLVFSRLVLALETVTFAVACNPEPPVVATPQGRTVAPADEAPPSPGSVWPTDGWPKAPPEKHGLDRSVLERFDRELAGEQHGPVDAMLVVRNGHVVFEKRYPRDYRKLFEGKPKGMYSPFDVNWHPYYQEGELHSLQSISKSVTSAMCWLRGRIRSRARADVRPGIPSLGRRDRGQDPDSSAPIRCPRDSPGVSMSQPESWRNRGGRWFKASTTPIRVIRAPFSVLSCILIEQNHPHPRTLP